MRSNPERSRAKGLAGLERQPPYREGEEPGKEQRPFKPFLDLWDGLGRSGYCEGLAATTQPEILYEQGEATHMIAVHM